MAKKPKPTLMEALAASSPVKRGPQSFFNRMPEGQDKQQLRDLHADFKAGNLKKYSVLQIHATATSLLGLDVGSNGFERWLKKASPDD